MARGTLLSDAARDRARDVVRQIESGTSAEIVVTVRKFAVDHRRTDLMAGALALVVPILAAFADDRLRGRGLLLDLAVFFALGFFFSRSVPWVRRALLGRRRCADLVAFAAREAFAAQGVGSTDGRTGVLVFVAWGEGAAAVIADSGIDVGSLGPEWDAAGRRLSECAAAGLSAEAFFEALAALGPPLARRHPRAADDRNELPDEVRL